MLRGSCFGVARGRREFWVDRSEAVFPDCEGQERGRSGEMGAGVY
jgi:hypothetical protein